jgi:hypothetical protein
LQGIAEYLVLLDSKVMPKAPRTTTNPLGQKILDVLREQGHADDLQYLATVMGVKAPSVHDWVNFGRLGKERFADLVRWSGKDLHWWFEIPTPIAGLRVQEPTARYGGVLPMDVFSTGSPDAQVRPPWPFPQLSEAWVCRLPPEQLAGLQRVLIATAEALNPPAGKQHRA